MTNGEKLLKIFPNMEINKKMHKGIQIDFDSDWWNAEYKEPTKALEQEPVLDKIRAEIRKKMKFNSFNEGYVLYDDITEVLDKYKAESEK